MKKFRGHKSHHNFNILAEPVDMETRLTKWYFLREKVLFIIKLVHGVKYLQYKEQVTSKKQIFSLIKFPYNRCENCYSFYFCESCYTKRQSFKPNTSTTHKFYHTFTTLDGPEALEFI